MSPYPPTARILAKNYPDIRGLASKKPDFWWKSNAMTAGDVTPTYGWVASLIIFWPGRGPRRSILDQGSARAK